MKAASVKTGRGNGSFSSIRLTECQEALSERQFGKQNMTCFVWSWRSCTKCFDPSFRINFCENPALKWLGLDQNIRLFEYSSGGLTFKFQFWDSNILSLFFFFFFFFYIWHPLRNGSHSRSNMNRPWGNVMIQFIWRWRQKTSAVWEHFKLSEDKTKAVCQICDLKLA